MKYRFLPALFVCFGLLIAGCDQQEQTDTGLTTDEDTLAAQDQQQQRTAVADLEPTEGNEVRGTVTFTEEDGGVRVVAAITGLTPGEHGFHVHENGDCSAPDASSAGGHFAPQNNPHGAPDDPEGERHVGDLGNIEADDEGGADYERVDDIIDLDGPNSVVGRAVVVHADADDLESDPSGNSGDRLACGVIELAGEGAQQSQTGAGTGMGADTTGQTMQQ